MSVPVTRRERTAAGARTWWLVLLVLLLAFLWTSDLVRVWRVTNHHDLDVFMLAARRLLAGEDIYQEAAPFQAALEAGTFRMDDDTVAWPYMYAPLIAMLLAPATALPYPLVQALWWGLNVLALGFGSWLVLRALDAPPLAGAVLGLAMLWRFYPAVVGLRLGQIEIIQFLLLAVSLYGFSRGWERRGAIALGVATALKFFPGALIVLLVWRRRWRAALWALGVALVLVVGSFAVVGLDAMADYVGYGSIYGIGGAFAGFFFNQSLNGFFSRNLIRNVFTATLKGWHLPGLARGLILLADLVVVAVSARMTWQPHPWPSKPMPVDHRCFGLQYGLGIVALLLISPHSQVYTYVWALIPFLVLGAWLLRGRGPWIWLGGGAIVAYFLIGRSYSLFVPGLTRLVQAHTLFGGLLLWGVLVMLLMVESPEPVEDSIEPGRI